MRRFVTTPARGRTSGAIAAGISLAIAIAPLAAQAGLLAAGGAPAATAAAAGLAAPALPAGCDRGRNLGQGPGPTPGPGPGPGPGPNPNTDTFQTGFGASVLRAAMPAPAGSVAPPLTTGTEALLVPANCHDTPAMVPGTRIKNRIDQINRICGDDRLQLRYRVHCLAILYTDLAQRIPDSDQYAELKAVVTNMAAELTALADANLDASAPPVAITGGRRGAASGGGRAVPAVRTDRLERTIAKAEQILDETATVLLRSDESSRARKVIYASVARGIQSSKLLLRSA